MQSQSEMYLGELSPLDVPFSNLAEEDWSIKPMASIEAMEAAAKAACGKSSAATVVAAVELPQCIGEIGETMLLLLLACIGAKTVGSRSKGEPKPPRTFPPPEVMLGARPVSSRPLWYPGCIMGPPLLLPIVEAIMPNAATAEDVGSRLLEDVLPLPMVPPRL